MRVIQGKFAKPLGGSREISLDHTQLVLPSGGGRPLPDVLQRKLSQAFGADLSDVRIHEGRQASALGAIAFTAGADIFFAPGHYQPDRPVGQRLLGHEIAHVLQQRAGRVRTSLPGRLTVIQDAALEAEAERMGMRAASVSAIPSPPSVGAVQRSQAPDCAVPRPGAPAPAYPSPGHPVGKAVQRVAAPARPGPPAAAWASPVGVAGIVQRMNTEIVNAHYTSPVGSQDYKDSKLFFNTFKASTESAYSFVLSSPTLSSYKDLDGHTKLWNKTWNDYMNGKNTKMMSANFGYAVESLATNPSSPFYPTVLPQNSLVFEQMDLGSTRPDLVLTDKGGGFKAFGDLTAKNSADHIFKKDNWSAKVPNFAEITYKSLDAPDYVTMQGNHGNMVGLTPKQLKARTSKARKRYVNAKKKWTQLGRTLGFLHHRRDVKFAGIDPSLDPEGVRGYIKTLLEEKLSIVAKRQVTVSEKIVPSVLVAMGVSATSWRYNTGYSQNLRVGEKFLMTIF
ncbi:DUF4157 domain-containing protein [Magnetospirillum sulfuroxidans]|uniref:DUF4157 domain-containing protein n=1 Tax=Magnetospirillum sulfuroxidans TaxID=611300 RepID=A0ABS5I823_9PROT|nr:DUF4157 domain-containing protein [Magnetospirillum sulfuroxidans]MBR9970302.1 DUF4157 domain-containing protein [Magnetospirillum sulfuroxidans]